MKFFILFLFSGLNIGNAYSQTDTFPYERDWATYFGPYTTTVFDAVLDNENNLYVLAVVAAEGIEIEAETYTTPGTYQPEYDGEARMLCCSSSIRMELWYGPRFMVARKQKHLLLWIGTMMEIFSSRDSRTVLWVLLPRAHQETLGTQEQVGSALTTASFIAKFDAFTGNLLWGPILELRLLRNMEPWPHNSI